jgi:hypothetical protein
MPGHGCGNLVGVGDDVQAGGHDEGQLLNPSIVMPDHISTVVTGLVPVTSLRGALRPQARWPA